MFWRRKPTPQIFPASMAFNARSYRELEDYRFDGRITLAVHPRTLEGDYGGLSVFIAARLGIPPGKRREISETDWAMIGRAKDMPRPLRKAYAQIEADRTAVRAVGRGTTALHMKPAYVREKRPNPDWLMQTKFIALHVDSASSVEEARKGQLLCSYNGHGAQFIDRALTVPMLNIPSIRARYEREYMQAGHRNTSFADFVKEKSLLNMVLPLANGWLAAAPPGSFTRHTRAYSAHLARATGPGYEGIPPQPHRTAPADLQLAALMQGGATHRILLMA